MSEPERNKELFALRVENALQVALGGNTAIVLVPPTYPKGYVLNLVVAGVPHERTHLIRMPTSNELHFEGTKGSVRIYDSGHTEYDRRQKRVISYPAGIPTFLHPEVDEAP